MKHHFTHAAEVYAHGSASELMCFLGTAGVEAKTLAELALDFADWSLPYLAQPPDRAKCMIATARAVFVELATSTDVSMGARVDFATASADTLEDLWHAQDTESSGSRALGAALVMHLASRSTRELLAGNADGAAAYAAAVAEAAEKFDTPLAARMRDRVVQVVPLRVIRTLMRNHPRR